MPVAGKSDVVIDKNTLGTIGFVTVTAGDATHTSIDIQDLYDAAREWEVLLENLDVESLVDGSGKEGIGGGNLKPPTMVWRAHVEINATAGAGPTVRIFRFDGGTTLSDEEAANQADPRSPLRPESFVEYDRTKGQEGALLNVADLERLRKWMTNANRLLEGDTANFKIWDDGADPDVDSPLETQDVTDKDGNPIVLPEGAPANRSEAT